ncbi:MAG: AI-2E family transporter [Methylococcaceae bacterium]|jgi:putative permease
MNSSNQFVPSHFTRRAIKRFLPNTQATSLAIIVLVSFVLIYSLSDLLLPVFVSIGIAYLLEGVVRQTEHYNMPRFSAVILVFSLFITSLVFLLFILIPIISQQAVELVQQIPEIISHAQTGIMRLPKLYPKLISENKIQEILLVGQNELLSYSQSLLSVSAASVMGLISAMIYLFLVPMMVFFLLKDKALLMAWFTHFLPKERHLSVDVWHEVDTQIGNYVRGKFAEVLILCAVSYVTYAVMGLNYALLLAVLMGLQVILPYIGATLVTFPVLGVAYFQFGLTNDDFMAIVIAYAIIQAVDGVLLVPLLFSEAVNLHALAIIVAILFFGGLWGFWGVFLAIPLATVVKAVLTAWSRLDISD